ncbi:MAG: ribokinase [Gammaproteobacteria bacterium]|nr:ribokinase [Gammaproteobacteria bacterium]
MKPRILNFGSCNIDHVYLMKEFVRPGETLACSDYQTYPGGKGLNQSIAIALAGGSAIHLGKIGKDGEWLLEILKSFGVNTDFLLTSEKPTGHAMIQVNSEGENAIVLHGGANESITVDEINQGLSLATEDDFLLIQNEINNIPYIIEEARRRKLRIAFNAAPITEAVKNYPLDKLDLLFVNEIEGSQLSGTTDRQLIPEALALRFPNTRIILTLGENGSIYRFGQDIIPQPAIEVKKVTDTTGAGDAFTGTFLAYFSRDEDARLSLQKAAEAASQCISRQGATTARG